MDRVSEQAASGRGGRGNIVKKDQIAPLPAPMDPSHYRHSSTSSANEKAAGGRGGRGNIANKDQFAPPPAPMGASLEVETATNRLTTHGRGGEGNWYWHVLEDGVFKRVVLHEQRTALLVRARVENGQESLNSNPLDEGDRVGSPRMGDEPSLCHTKSVSEDTSMDSGSSSKLSLRESLKRFLLSSTKRQKHRSTSSLSDCVVISRSSVPTPDLYFPPVTPIDRPSSPVFFALYGDELLILTGSFDFP